MGKRSSDIKISVIFYLKAVLVVIIKYILLKNVFFLPFLEVGWLVGISRQQGPNNHSDTETRNHVLIYLCWLVSKYILSTKNDDFVLFWSWHDKRVKLKQWLNDGGETELNSPAFLQIYKI